ncbi:MAG: T9SS type A sorting domain-containing protein, partial [Muribaculaceae bacterium]|nr:T9SS type A sorting domain-containing protein [Muribaculaceae bacterium]
TISNTSAAVTVSGADNIEYAVWDTSGRHVVAGRGRNTVTIYFTGWPAGVYIIKANNRTLKFINR